MIPFNQVFNGYNIYFNICIIHRFTWYQVGFKALLRMNQTIQGQGGTFHEKSPDAIGYRKNKLKSKEKVYRIRADFTLPFYH
jgi:hypothetical protein